MGLKKLVEQFDPVKGVGAEMVLDHLGVAQDC